MIPGDPGKPLAVRAEAGLHEEIVTVGEDLGPVSSFNVDDGDAVGSVFVVMDVREPAAVGRNDGGSGLAESGRDGACGTAAQCDAADAAGLVDHEVGEAAADGEIAAAIADLGADVPFGRELARGVARGVLGHEHAVAGTAFEPHQGLAVAIPIGPHSRRRSSARLRGVRGLDHSPNGRSSLCVTAWILSRSVHASCFGVVDGSPDTLLSTGPLGPREAA